MDKKEALSRILRRLIKEDVASIADQLSGKHFKISKQLLGAYRNGSRYPKKNFFEVWKQTFGDDLDLLMTQELEGSPDLLDELKSSYERTISEVKESMRETIHTLKNENSQKDTYIKELLKRLPSS